MRERLKRFDSQVGLRLSMTGKVESWKAVFKPSLFLLSSIRSRSSRDQSIEVRRDLKLHACAYVATVDTSMQWDICSADDILFCNRNQKRKNRRKNKQNPVMLGAPSEMQCLRNLPDRNLIWHSYYQPLTPDESRWGQITSDNLG